MEGKDPAAQHHGLFLLYPERFRERPPVHLRGTILGRGVSGVATLEKSLSPFEIIFER
jgi:hypothetical protein